MLDKLLDPVYDIFDGLFAWLGGSFGHYSEIHCELESADDQYTLVARDGSLVSIIRCHGAKYLVGPDEFAKIHQDLTQSLQSSLAREGFALQVYFEHDRLPIKEQLQEMLKPATLTAERLELDLQDLFAERIEFLSKFCATEKMYFVLWTRTSCLTDVQHKQAFKEKGERLKKANIPAFRNAQLFLAAIPELRDAHKTFVKTTLSALETLRFSCALLDIHESCRHIRQSVDADFTAKDWRPSLPGDKLPAKETKHLENDISNLLWPPLYQQLIPRDGENINLRTARIGDKIYATVLVELLPQDLQPFVQFFNRILSCLIPWRLSYFIESNGMRVLGIKPMISSILSFASNENKLISNAADLLKQIKNNSDETIVSLKLSACTWADVGEDKLLRTRLAELAKAIQGWGYMETTEVSGDAFQGVLSSALALNTKPLARATVAPLSDVVYLFPLTRAASPWSEGAVLFRSEDGKPWPYQPGSTLQTTWIDLIYARPGSGKSVLSNSINLALCLSGGLERLPRIAIIDIGPSSSGLISLLQEALPKERQHEVVYRRLQMTKQMSINPFDTQLGCRHPSPQERAFLVNFLTLLATPIGEEKSYDGITDMVGLIIDELYKNLADNANPHLYSSNLNLSIDAKIAELNITVDSRTSWWEITDALFAKDEIILAYQAQRYAVPLLADAASICRSKAIEDLYANVTIPTGENVMNAFNRMISSAIREYPILSDITAFDLGEARIVSLDLDEVAKSGGGASDRQTAIMYMLSRYILAKDYYLTEESLNKTPEAYHPYHAKRIKEIREDPKRIMYDEFHRTAKAKAVRDQVIVDMREGRKWKVHVSLLSQSLDDFDKTMVEFATAIFIMDAGPKQTIEHSTKVFGLSDTAKLALERRVHGPKAGGATFLAQFSTKDGSSTQLITSTIGPIELWAFNTTAEDVAIRNKLYKKLGASKARKILAKKYPTGSASKDIETRYFNLNNDNSLITSQQKTGVIDTIIEELLSQSQ